LQHDEFEQFVGKIPIDITDCVVHCDIPKGKVARCFDLQKSFLQVPLSPEVRPIYAFKLGGKVYQCTTGPMGVVFMPALMNVIMKILAYNEEPIDTVVHIDNVRFLGDPEPVDRAAESFKARCKFVGATLNEEQVNARHTRGVFLGVESDYEAGTVRLSEKTLKKIRGESAVSLSKDAKLEDLRVLFGLLFFASRVLRLPLAEFFTPIKYLRRRLAKVNKNELKDSDPAELWECAIPDLKRWIGLALENPWTEHRKFSGSEAVLLTDASTTGWGAVFYDETRGTVKAAGGQWPEKKVSTQINELETEAVEKALSVFRDDIEGDPEGSLLILLDNTATMNVLKKGHARSYEMNDALRKLQRRLPQRKKVRVAYITSEENTKFADPLSRGKTAVNLQGELQSFLGDVGGRLSRAALTVCVPRRGGVTHLARNVRMGTS
jgi:hypothetical protein